MPGRRGGLFVTRNSNAMIPDDLGHFYEAALTACAILSGFSGTFLSFRIQREASYFRQPCTFCKDDLHPTQYRDNRPYIQGHDVGIGLSRFNSSFFLIILGTCCLMAFGVFMPLVALSLRGRWLPSPGLITAGIVGSAVLVAAYFLDELIHYEILKWGRFFCDLKEWRCEWIIVVSGFLLAALGFTITWCAMRG